MDLNLSQEQLHFQEVARDFFAASSPLSGVREVEVSDAGYSAPMWAEMAKTDWLRIGISEEQGGAGGSLVDLACLYKEMGRNLAASPHLYSAVIAAQVLALAEGGGADSVLAGVLSGAAVVIPTLMEPSAEYELDDLETRVERAAGGGSRLTGTKVMVPFANSATHFMVPADTEDGPVLVLLAATKRGARLTRMSNISGAPLFLLELDCEVDPSEIVASGEESKRVLTRALEYGQVLLSAQIAGAGERLLDLAVSYGLSRKQFGELIGRFQAVQYLCSDIAIDAHLSWLYSLQAAGLDQEGLNLGLAASMAKAVASHSAPRMALRCHEVFAGVGFMSEVDVQLFTRRLRNWELELGDASYHRNRLGAAVARGELRWDD